MSKIRPQVMAIIVLGSILSLTLASMGILYDVGEAVGGAIALGSAMIGSLAVEIIKLDRPDGEE